MAFRTHIDWPREIGRARSGASHLAAEVLRVERAGGRTPPLTMKCFGRGGSRRRTREADVGLAERLLRAVFAEAFAVDQGLLDVSALAFRQDKDDAQIGQMAEALGEFVGSHDVQFNKGAFANAESLRGAGRP